MKILRTYVLAEHAGPFFVTVGGLTAVLLVGNLVKFADLVISKGVSPFDILRLLLYLIPYMLSFTVPMACLMAVVLALSRLSGDYELLAMRASGVTPSRFIGPLLLMGLVVSVALLLVNDRLVPSAHLAFRRQLKAIGIKQPTAYLEAGTFIKDFPPYVIFVYQVEGRHLSNVRIYEPQSAGPTRTIVASRGVFEPGSDRRELKLKLSDGTVDEWDPNTPGAFTKVNFRTYAIILRPDQEDPRRLRKKLKEMTLKELLAERRRLAAEGIDPLPVSLELHRKAAFSFAPLLFVACGLILGLRFHHQERLTGFLWMLGLFFAYYLGSIGMQAMALKGWYPPWVVMWVPNVAGGLVSGVLLARTVRH